MKARARLSIVVPVLDEADNLERLLPHLRRQCPDAEVILVDGGSTDRTALVAHAWPFVCYLPSERGRARQMNAGARAAHGDVLLFLHADTLLPAGAADAIDRSLRDPRIVGGRFDVSFANSHPAFQLIATFMNWRSRLTGIATGDQAIFVRREVFDALDGYPDIPLMEDVEFCARLKRRGRITCPGLRVITSARKWEREGILRTVVLMWTLRLLHYLRVDPARLHGWYYGRRARTWKDRWTGQPGR
ncbi:MAG TPA: TIGR04283 family arsenosugar biosynthesis glycosyltransferase [Candidatus Methylomirabilis sp.]|nr:TIGR04283 family arsenosugar biosynthesis glycosyltransferase [Candidatus Methylomirabilis sp.]